MNNCPKCGAMNDENATTCQICGSMLNVNMENNNTDIEINEEKKPEVFSYLNNEEVEKTTQEEIQIIDNTHTVNTNEEVEKKKETKLLIPTILLIIIIISSIIVIKNIFTPKKTVEDISITYKNDAYKYVQDIESYMEFSIKNIDKEIPITYSIKNRSYPYLLLPTSNKCLLEDFNWTGSEEGPVTCSSFMKDINDNFCQLDNKSCHVPDSATIYFNQEGKILENTEFKYNDYNCTYDGNNFTCTK